MLEIALALVERDGSILFVQRARDPMKGYWELPGGKIEAGEEPRDAAVRELFEETGLRAGRAWPAAPGSAIHEYPWATVRLHVFAISAEGAPLQGEFRAASEWECEDILPATREFLRSWRKAPGKGAGGARPAGP